MAKATLIRMTNPSTGQISTIGPKPVTQPTLRTTAGHRAEGTGIVVVDKLPGTREIDTFVRMGFTKLQARRQQKITALQMETRRKEADLAMTRAVKITHFKGKVAQRLIEAYPTVSGDDFNERFSAAETVVKRSLNEEEGADGDQYIRGRRFAFEALQNAVRAVEANRRSRGRQR